MHKSQVTTRTESESATILQNNDVSITIYGELCIFCVLLFKNTSERCDDTVHIGQFEHEQ